MMRHRGRLDRWHMNAVTGGFQRWGIQWYPSPGCLIVSFGRLHIGLWQPY